MIAKERSLIPIHNSINLLNKILFLLLLFALILFGIYLFSSDEGQTLSKVVKKIDKPMEVKRVPYEKIGGGALSIDSELQPFPFPDLSGQVAFLSRNNDSYLLAVGKGKCRRVVESGEKLYLTYDEGSLSFSDGATPLWVRPLALEEGKSALQMGVELISEKGELLIAQSRTVNVAEKRVPFKKEDLNDPDLIAATASLEGAHWWPPDRLFDRYAGEEYGVYRGLERLEILGERVLFSEEGKTFVWKEEKWEEGKEEGCPVAEVIEISPYKMEWEVRDGKGLEWMRLSFHRERVRPLSIRMEDVLTRLRQRTSSRVSCRIDNRAAILKAGDWLFRTERGWHTVKTSYEVDAIVKFKLTGELFIFDGLEKIDGKEFFCGTLFDSMRTDCQAVRLPISQIKTLEHSPSTKKGLSSKIQSPTSPFMPSKQKKQQPIEEGDIFEE